MYFLPATHSLTCWFDPQAQSIPWHLHSVNRKRKTKNDEEEEVGGIKRRRIRNFKKRRKKNIAFDVEVF